MNSSEVSLNFPSLRQIAFVADLAGSLDLGAALLQNRPKSSRSPKRGVWRGFRTRKVYHRGVVCTIHCQTECGSVHNMRNKFVAQKIVKEIDTQRTVERKAS